VLSGALDGVMRLMVNHVIVNYIYVCNFLVAVHIKLILRDFINL
jgi:hypothetical protein